MRLEKYTKALTAIKDTLIIAIIAVLGWRYFPLLIDPAQTSNFEIAEINLLVVKLKPEVSERAIPAAGRALAAATERPAGSSESSTPSEDATGEGDTADTQPSSSIAYYGQQRAGEMTAKPVAIPRQNVVSQNDAEAKARITGWSYLGTYRNGEYIDRIFDVDNTIAPEDLPGKTVLAKTDVFMRDDYPKFVLGWTKGDRMGVISEGTEIEIREVKLIPAKGGGSRVWIKS